MKKNILALIFLISIFQLAFAQIDKVDPLVRKINERPYPKWFKDAKLGIFIHWGLYSVPSYGGKESYAEWFLRGIQVGDTVRTKFMKDTYGQNFTYKDFTNEFKAELFDPNQWVDLFKKAGAKYVVLVSKHHDGYALWPSKYNRNWNSVDTGPKRDIVGELTKAVRKTDLKMGLYYSLAEWNHPLHRWYTDPNDSIGKYVEEYMIPQFKEVIGTYKPSLIFSDGEWFNSAKQWHSAELINWYYDLVGKDAIVNDRWGSGIKVGFLTPEYSAGIKVTDRPWVEVRGIGRSFGLNRNESLEAYDTSKELIQRFIQTVANGGGMIINVGPSADGQIPLIQQERLIQLGNWLKINGEAIYGTTPYIIKEEEKLVYIERVDTDINFNWVRNSPMKGIKEDNFSVEWKGYISVPKTGKYTFKTKKEKEKSVHIERVDTDDTVVVFIDGKLVIDKSYTGSDTNGVISLKEGVAYPIFIRYNEKKQNAELSLYWSSKKIKKQIVPSTAYFQDKGKTKPGIKGRYSSLKTYLCYTQNNGKIYAISFEWPDDSLVLKIKNPGSKAKVRMLGLNKTLDWEYKEGKMFIDTTVIKYGDLPSHNGWAFEIENQNQ